MFAHNDSSHTPWNGIQFFAGFDWAKDAHQLAVVDHRGCILLEIHFEHSAEGWAKLRRRLVDRVGQDLSILGVAIETNAGPAVEQLLQQGCVVFPMHPKAAQRYRDRKAPSGGKSDSLDAWSFADALRTDGHAWRPLVPEDPATQELRLLCRDEAGLIEKRTGLVNELRQALYEYYPEALEAFDDWTAVSAWAFVERFPTPQALIRAGKRRWEKFLHTHHLGRPQTYSKRLEVFARAGAMRFSPAVTAAKSLLALSLVKQLQVAQKQLKEYRRGIEARFAEHPAAELFASLPGAGSKLAPRLLAECAGRRDFFDSAQGLQCYAGTAPVRYQSGQVTKVRMRRACNKHLRAAVHLWSNLSRAQCPWAQTYYEKKRAEGQTHACALRCLGQRWLKILWKILQTGHPYDEALHTRNQIRHGQWNLTLQT